MIGDFILRQIIRFVTWMLEQFPAYTGLPSGFSIAVAYFSGKLRSLECVFPLDTLWAIIQINIVLAIVYLAFRFFRFVFKW